MVQQRLASTSDGWPSDAQVDRLIGDWSIYQRRGGHRTSTDDFLTAWYAVEQHPTAPQRYLDLGCGIGSVLLMVAHALRPDSSIGIEAQDTSALMAERSIGELPEPAPTVAIVNADFREAQLGSAKYELITGSPPYFPVGSGILPTDPQRRACRFETRGGIEAYCQAADRWLAEDGVFVVVFQSSFNERVLGAASNVALHLSGRVDVTMREDRQQPFLTVYAFRRQPQATQRRELTVRDRQGEWTGAYRAARARLGYGDSPPQNHHPRRVE